MRLELPLSRRDALGAPIPYPPVLMVLESEPYTPKDAVAPRTVTEGSRATLAPE